MIISKDAIKNILNRILKLDKKVDSHKHNISDVNNLQTTLDKKAPEKYNLYYTGAISSKFKEKIIGTTDECGFVKSFRKQDNTDTCMPQYGSGVAWGQSDSFGMLYSNYEKPIAYVAGGSTNGLRWSKQLAWKDDLANYSLTTHNHDTVYSKLEHTHNYAGSSTAGGSATSAITSDFTGVTWTTPTQVGTWSALCKLRGYVSIMFSIGMDQRDQCNHDVFLINTGWDKAKIIQLSGNGYYINTEYQLRLVKESSNQYTLELKNDYGYNEAKTLDVKCKYITISNSDGSVAFYNSFTPSTNNAVVFSITTSSNYMVGTISNAIKDSEGNTIKETYLKKSGGSVTGDITLNNKIRLVSKDKKGTEKALIWMNDATNGEVVVGGGTSPVTISIPTVNDFKIWCSGTQKNYDIYHSGNFNPSNYFSRSGQNTTNLNTCYDVGIYFYTDSTTGSPNRQYGHILNTVSDGNKYNGSNNWLSQLAFNTDDTIWHRSKVNSNGWTNWTKLVKTTDLNNYLPKSGGTMTGDLNIPAINLNNSSPLRGKETGGTSKTLIYMSNQNQVVLGSGSNQITLQTQTLDKLTIWDVGTNAQYKLWNTGNDNRLMKLMYMGEVATYGIRESNYNLNSCCTSGYVTGTPALKFTAPELGTYVFIVRSLGKNSIGVASIDVGASYTDKDTVVDDLNHTGFTYRYMSAKEVAWVTWWSSESYCYPIQAKILIYKCGK